MKRYALLSLLHNANAVIGECVAPDLKTAVSQFQMMHPDLGLDKDGYAKDGDVTYCVAEYWNPA